MWRLGHLPADRRDGARIARAITLLGGVVFVLVVTQGRPWQFFTTAGFSADFYDEQARSFVRGRLDVRPSVVAFEGFLVDGRTYLYYGPLLAVVRLPFAVFGELLAGRLTRLSLVAAYLLWCTMAFRLHLAAHPSSQGARWRVGVFMGAVAASPMLFLASWVSVYHETELWAAAFVLGAVVAALAWTRALSPGAGALAAMWAAAALLTRFPVGVGAAAAVGVAAIVVGRQRPRAVLPAVALLVGAVTTHVVVNLARFGTLLQLPADRQVLTMNDPERAAWFAGNDNSFFGLRFVPTTLAHYLRPDTIAFERLVPFVRFGRPATTYGGYPLETTQPTASLTVTAMGLAVLATAGLVLMIRRRQWLWLALTGAVAIGAAPTLAIGFIANRYLADLLPALVVPAAFGAAVVILPAAGWGRRLLLTGACVVVVWGLWSNVALALWGQNLKEPGFTEARYGLDGILFDGPPPYVRPLGEAAEVGRDGVIAVAPGCAGVYIAEQGRWVPLERSPGQRELRGAVDVDGPSRAPLATGPAWTMQLVVDAADGTGRVDVADAAGERAGTPVEVDGPTADVVIVADPTTGELLVTLDGRVTQSALGSRLSGPIEPGPDVHARPGGPGPLCELLSTS